MFSCFFRIREVAVGFVRDQSLKFHVVVNFSLYFFDRELIIYFNVYFILLLQVNYVKAIDKYLIVCFLFVFCSLLEYAIVLLLDRGKRKFEKEKNEVRVLVTCYSHHLICYKFLTREDWGRDFLSIPMLHWWDHKTGHRSRDKGP